MNRKQRRAAKKNKDSEAVAIEEKVALFDKLPDECMTCQLSFDKKVSLQNKFLLERLRSEISFKLIDEYGVNGDFVESQAFAYLAIRSFLGLPISFPETTDVKEPLLVSLFPVVLVGSKAS